ncbi:unnamed protein product [Scytosiphon promiscuus]
MVATTGNGRKHDLMCISDNRGQRFPSSFHWPMFVTSRWQPAAGGGRCGETQAGTGTRPWDDRSSSSSCGRGSRRLVPWVGMELMLVVLFFVSKLLGATAAEDEADSRPLWTPLRADDGEVFRSNEVLQMYHLQATAQLYEQGGLNHDLSFFLTAVGFHSVDRPEVKVSMAYHPTNMTISLLPVISEDGRGLRWDHQAASTSLVMGVDQAYWTAGSYMGETTGAFFSYAVEFSLDYYQIHPRYQPFSVYEDYPGREFLTASSCDEYVWALFSAAQTRGVRLTPALLPQKHKIVIYSHTEPEIIVLNGDGSGGGDGDDDGEDVEDGDASPDDPAEEGELPRDGGSDGGNGSSSGSGGDGETTGSDSTFSWSSSSLSSSASNSEEVVWADDADGGGDGGDSSSSSSRSSNSTSGTSSTNSSSSSSSSSSDFGEGQQEESGGDVPTNSTDGDERQRGRRLLWGPSSRGLLDEDQVLPAQGAASLDDAGGLGEGGDGDVAGEGEGQAVGVVGDDLVTPPPAEASATAAASSTSLDDWQQVVAYYQSVQLCLQERKFSFVTSLKDFARYFDCLDDVAFISIGPHEYYKVNLTSSKLDPISLPEDLPEVQQRYEGFTLADTCIAIFILMILACGIHGVLWQAAVIQHWLKSRGYGRLEETLPDEDDAPELEQHPSLARKISSEYLRLGQLFFGRLDDSSSTSLLPSVASAPRSDTLSAGDHLGDAASFDPEGVLKGLSDGSDSDRPLSHRRPPHARVGSFEEVAVGEAETVSEWGLGSSKRRQRPTGGGAANGEEGLEMQATGASAAAAAGGRQGGEEGPEGRRRGGRRGDGDGALSGGTNGVSAAAGDDDAPLVPPSPPSLLPNVSEEAGNSLSPVADPAMAGDAGRFHGGTRRFSSGAGGPYLGGLDGGGDRWIGFAGSPRFDRTGRGVDAEPRPATAGSPPRVV